MSAPHPVFDLLSRYAPTRQAEAADVARVLEVARTADDPWSRSIPLHVTASALIVHPLSERVLLRWHGRQGSWLQVGGHGDPGEVEPIEVALREAIEETGLPDLVPWPNLGLLHVAVVPVPANDREPAHEHADLRFLLTTARPDAARPEKPDAPLRWFSIPAAQAATTEANVRETLSRVEIILTH